MTDFWIIRPTPNPNACLRLFCFPYAGSGASIFRTWSTHLPLDIEVCSVQLPGRERRQKEPFFTAIEPLLQNLIPALLPYLDRPFAFFGHSVGALISFEVARHLRRSLHSLPLHLFVSGRQAPQLSTLTSPIYNLPTIKFLDKLRRYNGTPEIVLQNPELMNLFLPILRADLEINETYQYKAAPPLDCPISAFGGLQDREVSLDALAAWREQTSNTFAIQMFPGDHFFLKSEQKMLLEAITVSLRRILMLL